MSLLIYIDIKGAGELIFRRVHVCNRRCSRLPFPKETHTVCTQVEVIKFDKKNGITLKYRGSTHQIS